MEFDEIKSSIGIAPYYEDSEVIIYNADCLEIMKLIPDNIIDLVITDPPYGISGEGKIMNSPIGCKTIDYGEWDRSYPIEYAGYAYRILKDNGGLVSFMDHKNASLTWTLWENEGFKNKNYFFWDKGNSGINPRRNFISRVESGLWAVKGPKYTWNGGARKSIFLGQKKMNYAILLIIIIQLKKYSH